MYVAKTDKLNYAIDQNIRELFAERMAKAESWYNYGLNKVEFDRAVLDTVIPLEHQNIFQTLGAKYFEQAKDLSVIIFGERTSFEIPPTFLPNKITHRWQSDNRIISGPIYEIALKRREAIKHIADEMNELITAFNRAWNAVPSVNALMKVWPAAEHLLPDHVIQKVNQKNKRYNKAEISEQIDVNNLSSQLLKAKIQK